MINFKKISINHFVYNPDFSNGVTNYIKAVNEMIDSPYEEVVKPYEMSMTDFRKYIYTKFAYNEIYKYSIIEAAESQSSTLLLPNSFNIHVRLHCPFHLYKRIINEEPDEARYSDECRAIFKAKAVSSPSHAMLELLADDLDIDKIHVYKNPVKSKTEYYKNFSEKDIDVIFLSRFNNLKGIEYIEEVLSALPSTMNILIVGKQEVKINLSQKFDNVIFIDHVEGEEKYDLLARARVAISLSKFENCSMAILEALAVYTPIVAWDVGGNAELAPPSVLTAVPLGDTLAFASAILNLHEKQISRNEFEYVCEALNKDFHAGLSFVENKIINNEKGVYKGIDFRNLHAKEIYIPSEITLKNSELPHFPLNVCFLTSTIKASKNIYKIFEGTSFNLDIIYSGKYGKELSEYNPLVLQSNPTADEISAYIKTSNADVILVDESFKLHINDLFRIKQKTKKAILYCFASPVNNKDYCIDSLGFGINSDLYKRKIFAETYISRPSQYKRVIIWANDVKHVDYDSDLIKRIHCFAEVDIVATTEVLESFAIWCPSVEFNSISPEKVEHAIYTDVISFTDYKLDSFMKYPLNIYLINKSFFSNKGVSAENYLLNENIISYSYKNRMLALEFLEYVSMSSKNQNFAQIILQAYYRSERLMAK